MMDTGDVRRREEIIVNPEGWDDMVEKHKAREKQQVDKLLKKRKAETQEELQALAKKAIVTRMTRLSGEHTTVKDHTVKRDEEAGDIKLLRDELREDIKAITKAILEQAPAAAQSSLKGRKITLGEAPPAA